MINFWLATSAMVTLRRFANACSGAQTSRCRHDLLQGLAPVGKRAQRPLRVRHPRLARVGQAHAVRRAEEQPRAELALETMQARGERRLSDEEGFRGPAHAAPARHLEEPLDLDELYAVDLAVTRVVYSHRGGDKFYLWRRRSDTLAQIATAQTGAIVITNGRMVSLTEWEFL